MSLSSVKSQVDQIYILLKKLLNNQQNTNTQQVDLTPVTNGITQLKTDYLQDVLDKVRQQSTQFSDVATGWVPFFNKVSGIHTGIFDAGTGISGKILDVSASISDNSNGLKSIFDKANSIHTGIYDSTTGLAAKIFGLSGSINDETNGLKSIFDKSSNIHTGLFDAATGLSKKVLDISGSVDSNVNGISEIKTKLNDLDGITTATSLLNVGSYTLANIYNKANSASSDIASIKGTGVKNLQDVYTAISNVPTTSKNTSYVTMYGANSTATSDNIVSLLGNPETSIPINRVVDFDVSFDTGFYAWTNANKDLIVSTDSLSQITYSLSAIVPASTNFVLYLADVIPSTPQAIAFFTVRNSSTSTSNVFINGSLTVLLQKNKKYKLFYSSTTGLLDSLLLTINTLVP